MKNRGYTIHSAHISTRDVMVPVPNSFVRRRVTVGTTYNVGSNERKRQIRAARKALGMKVRRK